MGFNDLSIEKHPVINRARKRRIGRKKEIQRSREEIEERKRWICCIWKREIH
jgi:hypothetical protein